VAVNEAAPNAHRFEPLAPGRLATWSGFGQWQDEFFASLIGLEVEELRADYARMRMPYRSRLDQPAGVVHGGAIATLIDTVVVPAIGSGYDEQPRMVTVGMNIRYLGALVGEDAVAEGWVEQRGRSIVFCRAEVRTGAGAVVADGTLVYKVSLPRP
jgi:uncharacterized protein (TIGR00369 family)